MMPTPFSECARVQVRLFVRTRKGGVQRTAIRESHLRAFDSALFIYRRHWSIRARDFKGREFVHRLLHVIPFYSCSLATCVITLSTHCTIASGLRFTGIAFMTLPTDANA